MKYTASIFDQIEGSEVEQNTPEAAKPLEKKQEPAAASDGEERSFKPANSSSVGDSEEMPIDPNEIFSFAESKFKAISDTGDSGATIATDESKKTMSATEVMTPEMIEISAVMYVQILETIWSGLCAWFSGTDVEYLFDKKMKERYEAITAIYFKAQNIRLTPTHFFVIMTLFILFAPAWKAYGDRKRRLKAESFKRKVDAKNSRRQSGEQTTLFDVEPVVRGRLYYACEKDEQTGKYFYSKDAVTGKYAKKGEREIVPPELETFIVDFKEKNGEWPSKKQVDIFLKS